MLAAVLGGAAIVATAATGLAFGQEKTGTAASSGMNLGATSTESTPPSTPATPVAVPAIRGPAKK